MKVELRAVPGCPNLSATRDLLHACIAQAGLPADVVVERIGEFPSPSVLVDGVDVTGASADASAACVLTLPAAGQIRAALSAAATRAHDLSLVQAGAADCWLPGDPIRVDRPVRAATLPPPIRRVHQLLLRQIAATGIVPGVHELTSMVADTGVDASQALQVLARQDLIALNDAGAVVAAYPFSPAPTDHVVEVGGVRLWAMCAVDALGIPFMLDHDATIRSRDPLAGTPVTVTVTAGRVVFEPVGVVVVYAATGVAGRSVDTCCATINFFNGPDSAGAWIAAHPHLSARVLDQDAAITLGRDIFGPLVTDG